MITTRPPLAHARRVAHVEGETTTALAQGVAAA